MQRKSVTRRIRGSEAQGEKILWNRREIGENSVMSWREASVAMSNRVVIMSNALFQVPSPFIAEGIPWDGEGI